MPKILVLGSGKVVSSMLEQLQKNRENTITVASNNLQEAQDLVQKYSSNTKAVYLDLKKKDMALKMIKKFDIVFSMVFPILHKQVLELCVQAKKDFVCTSYMTDELLKLSPSVSDAKMTAVFECGLDPGIDHIVTLMMIQRARDQNEKVLSLQSYCGGLIAPQCIDNPLGYKFTWSPIGVLRAISDCVFLQNGKEVKIDKKDQLVSSERLFINNALNLVGYPNRDSTKYLKIYCIPEAKTLIRGTIRYQGYAETIGALLDLGFLDETLDYKDEFLKPYEFMKKKFNKLPEIVDLGKLINKITKSQFFVKKTENEKYQWIKQAIEGLQFLGIFDPSLKIKFSQSILVTLVSHMEKIMSVKSTDQDFIVLYLKLDTLTSKGRVKTYTFLLQMTGDANKHTAMAKTVGGTGALAGELILNGQLKNKGMIGPFDMDLCSQLYKKLLHERVIEPFKEQTFSDSPKLQLKNYILLKIVIELNYLSRMS